MYVYKFILVFLKVTFVDSRGFVNDILNTL
jgi:hypothetical protein